MSIPTTHLPDLAALLAAVDTAEQTADRAEYVEPETGDLVIALRAALDNALTHLDNAGFTYGGRS